MRSVNNTSELVFIPVESNVQKNTSKLRQACLANKQEAPAIKVINQELSSLYTTNNSRNYNPTTLSQSSNNKKVNSNIVTQIVNSDALNASDCYALSMLKIFASIAKSMESTSKWQTQTMDMMDKLNIAILDLSDALQKMTSELKIQQQHDMEAEMRKSGILGLLMNIAILAIGIAMCIPSPSPMGVMLILNTTVQMVGNIGKIADPEEALKDNSWQNSLTQNGLFAVFDLAGEGAGQKAQTIGTILMLLLSEGSSATSTVANKAVLTGTEIACRGVAMLDNIVKVIGMIGSLFPPSTDNNWSDENQDNIWAALSMGSFATISHEIIHATGADKDATGKLIDSILGAVIGVVAQAGLQKGGYSNKLEDEQINKITQTIRAIDRVYNISNQAKNINTAEVRGEIAFKNSATKIFESDSTRTSKQYELLQTQFDPVMNMHANRNDELIKAEQTLVELVKEVEQIFQQIFVHPERYA